MSIASSPIGYPIAGGVVLAKAEHTSSGGACMAAASLIFMSTMVFVGNAGAVCGGSATVTRSDEIMVVAAQPHAVGRPCATVRQQRFQITGTQGFVGAAFADVVQQYRWVRFVTSTAGAVAGGSAEIVVSNLHVSVNGAVAAGTSPFSVHSNRTGAIGAVVGSDTTATAHTPIIGGAGAVMSAEALIAGFNSASHIGSVMGGVTGGSAIITSYHLRPSLNVWYFVLESDVITMGDI